MPCGVVVFTLFYCRLDLCCGEWLLWLSAVYVFSYLCICLCFTVLVNRLLNAFAICVCEVNVFSLKFLLLAHMCMVFQIVCVLCL